MCDIFVPDRVKAGAEVLDAEDERWWLKIDLQDLDVTSYHHCVLGQLYGDYSTGLDILYKGELAHYDEWAVAHGFDAKQKLVEHEDGGLVSNAEEYDALTRLWADEINVRRLVASIGGQ